MAKLEKIKICGIRSFGPNEDDVQTIKFHKPLTLILGANGCGKSTIIECLRYLTAQKEPSGKGAFVHDPALTGGTTVKGFVKLQITDARGNRVDLCRQLQCTRTTKTLSTKTLDNVITTTNRTTKEKQSISNRCADFSYEISRIFGVSKAILENVIFCTQEDSHWPLDTDQKLKEKFDQIFDSDAYNKCVGKVRDKIKKIRETCKISDVEIKYLQGNRKMAGEKRREVEKTKKQVKECEQEIAELNASLEPIDLKLKEINEKELEMSKSHALKETKKMELKQVENYILELQDRIKDEFVGTDEELRLTLTNFSKDLAVRQKEISRTEDKIMEYSRLEGKLSKELMTEQGKLGQLQKEEEIIKERISERTQNLNSLAVQLDIDSSEMCQSSDEDSVQYLISRVQTEIGSRECEVKMLKQKCDKEESDLQCTIDQLREKSMGVKNEVTNKEANIRDRKKEMEKIKRELNEIEYSVSNLSKLEVQLSRTNKTIEELQKNVDVDEIKDKIQRTMDERSKLEDRLSEVEETVKVLQQNASVTAELEVQKDLLSGKESDIHRIINKHKDNLKIMLGRDVESGFKTAVQSHVDKLKRSVKELTSTLSRKEKEVTELDMKRKQQKEQLRMKEEKLRTYEDEVYEECGSDDFDEVVSSLQTQIDDLQELKGILSSSEFMYQKYIQGLRKPQPCCPLCHRDFTRESEAQVLIEELTSKVEEVPAKLLENKNNLEEKQKRFNKLLTLRSKYDQIVTLKTVTLPNMRTELERLESTLKKTKKELEEIGNQILPLQTDEAVCSSMQGDMALLDQLQLEKKKIGWEIDKLESRLGSSRKGEGSTEEMFREQETLRKNLKNTQKLLEELRTKLNNHNEELQIQQSNKNSLMEEMNKIEGGVGRKNQLNDRHEELKSSDILELEELDRLKDKLDDATRLLNDAISKGKLLKASNSDRVDRLSQSLNGYQKQMQDIELVNNQIKAYEGKGVKRKLESVQKTIKKLESDLNDVKLEKERATKAINDTKRDLLNQENRERELEDNLKYREKLRERESLSEEVVTLERKYGDVNFDAILTEKRKLKNHEDAIGRKKATIQGRMGELDVRIEQLEKELTGKMLKNVDADYQKEVVKLTVLKLCLKDLERYVTTMEYAMMAYHKQKMARVNSFIREYWRKIYQGNDIDYIEIHADTIASTEKRRNYNYKLIQIKDRASLDMRNRCSAGQKMLASLIIRMALAETFSGNCGILTLDEPTTNLDRKNIKNLAQTLADILRAKQNMGNGNFQLIVITHDEEFLQELMSMEDVSEYVHVQRNTSGRTRVTRETFDGSIPRLGTLGGPFQENLEDLDAL